MFVHLKDIFFHFFLFGFKLLLRVFKQLQVRLEHFLHQQTSFLARHTYLPWKFLNTNIVQDL